MSSKLRTLNLLEDAIDKEVAWRRQELSRARLSVKGARAAEKAYLIRCGIALTYAHWEGWVQSVSRLYLEFVNRQRVPYRQLAAPLLGGALKSRLSAMECAQKARVHSEFARFIAGVNESQPAYIDLNLIRTESNLSSSVLSDILERIGLPSNLFELSSNFIDSDLLDRRNGVAHGVRVDLNVEDFLEISDHVVWMLDEFTDRVRNAAACREYRTDQVSFLG